MTIKSKTINKSIFIIKYNILMSNTLPKINMSLDDIIKTNKQDRSNSQLLFNPRRSTSTKESL